MLLLNPLSHSILDIYNLMSLITKAFYIKDYEDFDFLYGHDNKILDCNALQLVTKKNTELLGKVFKGKF